MRERMQQRAQRSTLRERRAARERARGGEAAAAPPAVTVPESRPVTPAPPSPSGDDFRRTLLIGLAEESAPIAARSVDCLQWPSVYWLEKVIRAEVEWNVTGVAEVFRTRFNQELDAKSSDPFHLPCSTIHNLALDYLVMWTEQAERQRRF